MRGFLNRRSIIKYHFIKSIIAIVIVRSFLLSLFRKSNEYSKIIILLETLVLVEMKFYILNHIYNSIGDRDLKFSMEVYFI